MLKLRLDRQSGWRYTQDNRYVIHKTYGAHLWWDVRELAADGTYRLIHSFESLKAAREYLELLTIYKE